MPLTLSNCTPSDSVPLATLHQTIFSIPPLYIVSYGHVSPTAMLTKLQKGFSTGLSEQSHPTPIYEKHYLKVTDPDLKDTIVAYAVWIFLPRGYDVYDDPQSKAGEIPAGANAALVSEFARRLGVVRGEGRRAGEAHWCTLLSARYCTFSPSPRSFTAVWQWRFANRELGDSALPPGHASRSSGPRSCGAADQVGV